ncbi:ATP-grasp fold amidoligase family protein [Vibrio splendidus]|uniref:ATP-grasp fold amidoligase family protein n=1 Tax=Vibrio splendidus TaxID=29497 RepID=UPI00352C36BF
MNLSYKDIMKKNIKNAIRDFSRKILGKKIYIKLRFLITHRYLCNLDSPITWNEKIQVRKLESEPEKYSKYVDKYTVRQYVSDTIGSSHLIPLLGKYRVLKVSDFDSLPNQFVLKTSNGGGGENVRIIRDKSKVDLERLAKDFNNYLGEKIGSKIDELFYDVEEPFIIAEKLMLTASSQLPVDFKLHIFNGVKQKIFVQIDQGRFVDHRRGFFDILGIKQDFKIQPKYKDLPANFELPIGFEEMLFKARKLSEIFDYVRVDMYLIEGQCYFGELTFCHGSGWEPVYPREYDKILGSYWNS